MWTMCALCSGFAFSVFVGARRVPWLPRKRSFKRFKNQEQSSFLIFLKPAYRVVLIAGGQSQPSQTVVLTRVVSPRFCLKGHYIAPKVRPCYMASFSAAATTKLQISSLVKVRLWTSERLQDGRRDKGWYWAQAGRHLFVHSHPIASCLFTQFELTDVCSHTS